MSFRWSIQWVAAFGALLLGPTPQTGAAGAAPSETGPAVTGRVHSATLEYQACAFSFFHESLDVRLQAAPFAREPDWATAAVERGRLTFGGRSDREIPFAWCPAQGRLHLDLNRNGDLTDDPAGVFGCEVRRYSLRYQTFTNIQLVFTTATGSSRHLVDLTVHNYGNRPSVSAALRSFCQGKLTLQGREWQIGLVQHLDRDLNSADGHHWLLRPWAERDQRFDLDDRSLAGFPVAAKLFIDQKPYEARCLFEADGDLRNCRFELRETTAALGELTIDGSFIARLLLRGEWGTVVLNSPGPNVSVPVGDYPQCEVRLERDGVKAFRTDVDRSDQRRIVVVADKPAAISAGGPLTNTVSVGQRGRVLVLQYQLKGRSGHQYQLVASERSEPPRFAVYQGDKEVAAGNFEYG